MAGAVFASFLLVLAAQRLWELRVSARHETALRARGATEVGAAHFPFMVAVHAAWFLGMAAEAMAAGVRFWPGSGACFALYLAAECLRSWAQSTLGERWTVRVLVLPRAPRIVRGPYRWMRHPNYVAVFVQVLAVPLVFSAWRTAIAGSALFLLVLFFRLRAEEMGLRAASRAEAAGPVGAAGSRDGVGPAAAAVSKTTT